MRKVATVFSVSVLCVAAGGMVAPSSVSATVVEYAADGTVDITDHRPPDPPTRAEPGSRAAYRALAEATAFRYAASEGVRAVGLDALSFARLFSAMIAAESNFDPVAVSSAGAQGLGQLMPDTAAALGVEDPFDPAENVDGAARYLVAQLERFRSIPLALAAYNAGPERVVEHGGIPPIGETIRFVATVTSAAGVGGAPPTVMDAGVAGAASAPASVDQRRISVWQF